MKLIVLALVLTLSACANPPIHYIAKVYDTADPCQRVGKNDNYEIPRFCGSSGHVISVTPIGSGYYRVNRY